MKKISVLLIAALMVGCMMVGCGNSGSGANNNNSNNNNQSSDNNKEEAYEGYVFKLKDTEIELNAKMEELTGKLGKEDAYFESNSCAFQGMDKVYTYGSVVISTYPLENVDYVYTIELKDDTVETPEGIYIGASKADVEKAYGTPTDTTETAYIYAKGESILNILFEDDCVSSIVYMAVTE